MKKKKIQLKKLLLHKQTVAMAHSVQGGIGETKVVVVCKTLVNTNLTTKTIPTTNPVTNSRKTYCLTECIVCV